MLGTLDNIASSWFGSKRGDPKAPNFLFVKPALAKQLEWPVTPINSTQNYASTRPIAMPLPKMIMTYLSAALDK